MALPPLPPLSFTDTGHAVSGAGGFDGDFSVNFAPVFGDKQEPPWLIVGAAVLVAIFWLRGRK